jgi:hypothetical protein
MSSSRNLEAPAVLKELDLDVARNLLSPSNVISKEKTNMRRTF